MRVVRVWLVLGVAYMHEFLHECITHGVDWKHVSPLWKLRDPLQTERALDNKTKRSTGVHVHDLIIIFLI